MSNIVEIAKKYIGQKEKPGNQGFVDPEFEKKMVNIAGFRRSEAWCVYFAELVLKEAYPDKLKLIDKYISPSSQTTYNQFAKATEGPRVTETPEVGALMIMQRMENGKGTIHGHAGIVIEVLSNGLFKTVEGNTNAGGSREGDSVQEKLRSLKKVQNGLQVRGFIIL